MADNDADVTAETSLTSSNKRGLRQQFRDFKTYFSCWRHIKVLFATSTCWFLLSVPTLAATPTQTLS